MDIRKAFGTNRDKEAEGVWFPLDAETRVKVARAGNKHFNELARKLGRPHQTLRRVNPEAAAKVFEKIAFEVLSKTILLDWENLKDNGVLVPYSPAKAAEMLEAYPDFFEVITTFSNELKAFQDEDEAAVQKN